MSNQYGQSDADPAGNQPTEQFWAGPGAPPGMPGPGITGHPVPVLPEQPKKDHRRALHWTAGPQVAPQQAGGGAIAGLRLAGHSSPASSTGPAASAPGALLNETLTGASADGAAARACARAGHVSRVAGRTGLPGLSRRIGIGAARCRLVRRRVFAFFLMRGVDGQFTIQTQAGIKTLAYERGVIQSVTAGKSITIKASDGTTWTWDLISATVARDSQGTVAQSALTSGTPVWAGGPVVQGTKDARLIVVRPPLPASVPPSSTPGN